VKDATGQVVEFGDAVHVKVGNEWVHGHVVKVQEGGIAIAGVAKQAGQTPVTPDMLVIQLGVMFMEQPGQPHPGVLKLASPSMKAELKKSPILVGDA
jgi:hypothetical protein